MRDDMAKMLVETHRHDGYAETSKSKRSRDNAKELVDLPTKESARKPYYGRKEFGENFPPLLGFLRKNCGRNWDSVYSELCGSLKGGGTVIEHTKMHLFRDFLEVKPLWVEGKPYTLSRGFGSVPTPIREGHFYIDKQGRLQMAKPERKAQVHPKPRDYINEDGLEYLRINDVWFKIETKRVPESSEGKLIHDVVSGKLLAHNYGYNRPRWGWTLEDKKLQELRRLYSKNGKRYATSKRQVSSKEIKRKNLNKPR